MSRWTDVADWIGPTVNEGDGDGRPGEPEDAMSTVVGIVLHIQEGTEAGTESWQRNPAARVSSHFLLPKRGRPRQMVDTHDRAWCQVAGNRHWISLECEGRSGEVLTGDQLAGAAAILARAHREYGVRLALATDPAAVSAADPGAGVAYHALGGAAWGGHYDCPGKPIIAQRPEIITRAGHLLAGADAGNGGPTVLYLAKIRGNAAVVTGDGIHRRAVANMGELTRIQQANRDGGGGGTVWEFDTWGEVYALCGYIDVTGQTSPASAAMPTAADIAAAIVAQLKP